jgi:hypothetical protein
MRLVQNLGQVSSSYNTLGFAKLPHPLKGGSTGKGPPPLGAYPPTSFQISPRLAELTPLYAETPTPPGGSQKSWGKLSPQPGQTLYRFLHELRALGVVKNDLQGVAPKDYPTSAYYDSYYGVGGEPCKVVSRLGIEPRTF